MCNVSFQITRKDVDSASVDPPAIVLTVTPVHHEGPPEKVYIKVLGLSEEISLPLFAGRFKHDCGDVHTAWMISSVVLCVICELMGTNGSTCM